MSKFVVLLVALGPFLLACGDDGGDDGTSDAGEAGESAGKSGATGGKGGAGGQGNATAGGALSSGGTSGAEDFTTCVPRECDESAELEFDFSGDWSEVITFTSNDCEGSIQDLLPPAFMNPAANFEGQIIGTCIRAEHDPSVFTGAIDADLSGARYCGIASVPVDEQGTELPIINHTTWTSIEEDLIQGSSAIYIPVAGCTLRGDYTLTRATGGGDR